MFRYILIFLFCFNIMFSEENNESSELELFLFKIGFEDFLKDVDVNKEKSSLNEKEINKINEKIQLIMNELYENKKILLDDSTEASPIKKIEIDIQKEMQTIRSEITLLKEEMNKLKEEKVSTTVKVDRIETNKDTIEKLIVKKERKPGKKMRVASETVGIYKGPHTRFDIIGSFERETIIEVDRCRHGWCRLNGEKLYVREFLIRPYE